MEFVNVHLTFEPLDPKQKIFHEGQHLIEFSYKIQNQILLLLLEIELETNYPTAYLSTFPPPPSTPNTIIEYCIQLNMIEYKHKKSLLQIQTIGRHNSLGPP